MPKYRLLTKNELQELEKEFVEYLILNSITAEEWETMKIKDQTGAERIIDLFSDVVFESILRKINFLEYRDKHSIRVFQCLPEKLVVVAMESTNTNEDIDFTNVEFLKKATISPPDSLKLYTTDKPYTRDREYELFEMLQTGCLITDDRLFKTLCLMFAEKNNS